MPPTAPEGHGHIDFGRLLHVRNGYGPSFDGTGTHLHFITDITGLPQGWRVPVTGGWPERTTFVDERVGFVSQQPGGDALLIGWDQGGDEKHRLALQDVDGNLIALTHDTGAMHPFGAWSPDGRHISYATNERDRRELDVVVYEVATGLSRTVLRAGEGWYAGDFSPDGTRLLAMQSRSSFDQELRVIDIASGTSSIVLLRAGTCHVASACWAAGGASVYVATDVDDEFARLCHVDLATGQLTRLDQGGADVSHLALSPDGSKLAFLRNVEGYSALQVLDLTSGALLALPELPRGIIARGGVAAWRDGLEWSPDSQSLTFSLVGATFTQNVWVINLAEHRAHQVTWATQAGIASERMAEPRLVAYPTFDGRDIPAFLYAPQGATPDGSRAAVIQIHGGPEGQSRPAFDPVVQYLVQEGYVVLVPNVRGSTGYGKTYSHLDDVEKRLDSVADIAAGAHWLAQRGWARSDRIACMGGSYGGFMVLSCLTEFPDIWAAGVEFYGVANFATFFQRTAPWRRAHRAREYGDPVRDAALFDRISPIHRIDRIVAPLFVFHGANDVRVPIEESEQIVAALSGRGSPVEYLRVEDEGHSISKLHNRLRLYPAVARFLNQHLRVD